MTNCLMACTCTALTNTLGGHYLLWTYNNPYLQQTVEPVQSRQSLFGLRTPQGHYELPSRDGLRFGYPETADSTIV